MPSDFKAIRKLYDDNKFVELLHHPNGIFWLKLRSISRSEQIREFCQRTQLDIEGIQSRQLFEHVYNQRPDNQDLENFYEYGLGVNDIAVSHCVIHDLSLNDFKSIIPFQKTMGDYLKFKREKC